MAKTYVRSKPFPNGMTYQWWMEQFCHRCKKYQADAGGQPVEGACATESAVATSYFDLEKWPGDDVVETPRATWACRHFESDDEELMRAYRELFKEAEEFTGG